METNENQVTSMEIHKIKANKEILRKALEVYHILTEPMEMKRNLRKT